MKPQDLKPIAKTMTGIAKMLGFPVSTVQGWFDSDNIPLKKQRLIENKLENASNGVKCVSCGHVLNHLKADILHVKLRKNSMALRRKYYALLAETRKQKNPS